MTDAASIQTSDVPENPSNSLNPSVGIKKPQYMKHDPNNKACKCDKCMKTKADDFWSGSAFAKKTNR